MPKTKISEFSATPGNNTDIDGINIAEGCAPSGINDAIRELMAQLKDFQAGTAGDSFNGPVGTTTAAAGSFTTLSSTGNTTLGDAAGDTVTVNGTATFANANPTLSAGTANGVAYLNGSKVLTTGSALVFDGSNLGLGVTPSAWYVYKAMQVGQSGAVWSNPAANELYLSSNYYYSSAGDKYIANGYASFYRQLNGAHTWATAPSGTAGNAITFTQAMTLDASGHLLLGATSQSGGVASRLYIKQSTDSAYCGLNVVTAASQEWVGSFSLDSSGNINIAQSYLGAGSYQGITFTTSGSERARITSSGDLLVGTTSASDTADLGIKLKNNSGDPYLVNVRSGSTNSFTTYAVYSTGAGAYRFYVGMGGTVYATSTTITAISDQRLKENIQDLDVGLDAVMALKPRKFDWKAGKGKDKKGDRGWIAQEFEQVFPDMIDTWRDPAPEGEEPYKAVNADLIPVLVKALQEMKQIVDAQAARIAALEAK